jgi:hypothetical protein
MASMNFATGLAFWLRLVIKMDCNSAKLTDRQTATRSLPNYIFPLLLFFPIPLPGH